jgi:hypothetical protein
MMISYFQLTHCVLPTGHLMERQQYGRAAAFGRRLARAARPTPMLPSAPPTFSMMTPTDALIRSATIRPVTSPEPKPAAEGMIMVMGRAG